MNDKTIIELVVSQKIMICQYFAVQLFVSVFEGKLFAPALNNCQFQFPLYLNRLFSMSAFIIP